MSAPGFHISFCAATALLVFGWGAGRLLVPTAVATGRLLGTSALLLGWGLFFRTGAAATWLSGRLCYRTLVPVMQLLLRMGWLWRPRQSAPDAVESSHWQETAVLLLLPGPPCAWSVGWRCEWTLPGRVRALHVDLGHMVQLASGFPKAQISSHWAALRLVYAGKILRAYELPAF